MADQVPFGTDNFAENPEPRCPSVLILDVSASMKGAPIAELNAGLQIYRDELAADPLAAKRVEVAVVSFGGQVELASDFCTAATFVAPTLTPRGDTPMGAAIAYGLDTRLPQGAVPAPTASPSTGRGSSWSPTVVPPTNGGRRPIACATAKPRSRSRSSVGVQGRADVLQDLSTRQPLQLDGLRFRDLFMALQLSAVGIEVDAGRGRAAGQPHRPGAGPRSDRCGAISPRGQGASHVRSGVPCQTQRRRRARGRRRAAARLRRRRRQRPSADVGAEMACCTLADEVCRFTDAGGRCDSRSRHRSPVADAVRAAIQTQADAVNLPTREFAHAGRRDPRGRVGGVPPDRRRRDCDCVAGSLVRGGVLARAGRAPTPPTS